MPLTESEKEILFHQPANLNETPDSADPQKKHAPPSKRVVRPSAEASLSDVIRHQPPAERPAGRDQTPHSPSPAEASAQAEFAAAAARARAAVNQHQIDTEAKKEAALRAARANSAAGAGPRQASEPGTQPSQQVANPNPQTSPAGRQRPPAANLRPQPQPQPQPQPARAAAPPPRPAARPKSAEVAPATQPAAQGASLPSSAQAAPAQSPGRSPATAPEPARSRPSAPASAAPAPARAVVVTEAEAPPPPQAPEQPQAGGQPAPRSKRESGAGFLLHTHGLKKVYDGRAVVNGVEVTVRPSEIVGLLGPNGAGKTTTFYMIVGLIQPNGGSVTFDGKDATHQPMYRRARLGMGYLPQEESIFRKLSVEDNILAVMETQSIPRSERRDRCHELMKRFGIEKLAKNEAITLSGGEKRRLTIARSLVTNPKLLMLDEPFSGVDPIAVGEIQEIVRSLREQGLAILITDHNVRETLDIVDRAYLLFEGRVEREGTRDFLINDPLSRQLYLGERFSM